MRFIISIEKQPLDNLFRFLSRTTVRGEEVPAFNEVISALRGAIADTPPTLPDSST